MGRFSEWEIIGGIVAVLLAVAMIISLINPPSKKHYNPSHNLHSQHTCKGLGVVVSPAPSNHKAHTQSKTQSENEQWCAERSDLAAQWKTADITSTAFWAGALGIWLVGWTLIATRQASIIAKDTAQKELRAYISLSKIEDLLRVPYNKDAIIRVNIRNDGQTPARNMQVFRRWVRLITEKGKSRGDLPHAESKIIDDFRRVDDCDLNFLGSGKVSGCSIDSPNFVGSWARQGLIDMVLVVRVEYTDIYDVKQVSEHYFSSERLGPLQERETHQYQLA